MMDRFSKRMKFFLTNRTTANASATISIKHFVPNFRISTELMTWNDSPFPLNVFLVICSKMRKRPLTITEYRSQIEIQAKESNSTSFSRLHHDVVHCQRDRDRYVVLLLLYTAQVSREIKLHSFYFVLSRLLHGSAAPITNPVSLDVDNTDSPMKTWTSLLCWQPVWYEVPNSTFDRHGIDENKTMVETSVSKKNL